MTQNLVNSRNEVMDRMLAEARTRGGNAVVAMRSDTSEMGGSWTEICACGTAVAAVSGSPEVRRRRRRWGTAPDA
jgi:uncharacterized protein YbjQ (UPF0145 family)